MILELLKEEYSVYKFNPEYIVKGNIFTDEFISITKTKEELSITAPINKFNDFTAVENGWKILKFNGILDFSLVGILNKISGILANENISIFVISTYNTDYIMVKKEKIKKTIEVLVKNQYEIEAKGE
jgi:hypothetical protein